MTRFIIANTSTLQKIQHSDVKRRMVHTYSSNLGIQHPIYFYETEDHNSRCRRKNLVSIPLLAVIISFPGMGTVGLEWRELVLDDVP